MCSSGSASATREDVRGVFFRLSPPSAPLTAAEVAADLDCSAEAARGVLDGLADAGELRTKRVGDETRVWWRDSASEGTPDATDETEFAAFVSAVQDYAIFTLDADGVVASWNEGAERIKGYEEDDIVGEHFSTFYTDADVDDAVPETNLQTAAVDGRVEDEGWRVRADGSTFWANVVITAVYDDDGELEGFTKVTQDLTEQREYEQQLRRERDLTEQILETVPVSICVLTADGEFVRANQRMLDRLGVESDDVSEYGVEEWQLYDGDGDPIPVEEWPFTRVAETGDPVYDYQCQVDVPDVGRRWLSVDAAPLDAGHVDDTRVVVSVDDITERKDRERRLRRESEQTEQLLRTAPIAIAVQDADGDTVLANQRAQDALGLTEQELIEDSHDEAGWSVYDADGEPVDPSETPSARVLETGEPVFDEELVFDGPDGDRLHLRVNAAPLFGPDGTVDRVVTAAEDITALKRREAELEQRKSALETELSDIHGRISEAFYAVDDEWRLTHLNDQAADLLGRPREDLLGRELWAVLPESTDDAFRDRLETALRTQEAVTFEEYVDGADAWLEFNVYPSESGLSIYFRDVTERKEYQRKLEESNERLEQFAYAASHDLQEPLRMVSSYLSLIEQRYADELDEDGREFIEFAVDGADRMRDMIDGLLRYSRVDTRGDPFEPVDLDAVLSDVRDDLQIRIADADATLTAEPLPRVDGDPGQLRQLLQNLVENAIEYSGEEPPEVRVAAERDGDDWVVSVSDDGIGIDPEDTDRVFEVFERLHGHDEHAGTGIGLALCRRIVERHGGDIWIDSAPGDGTTVSFRLPAAEEADD
ncbi:PAS domain-containing sensor histidine kinase [Halobaculum sp. D14]|uniref:PAS domain-containing sensor histidine kinase n=1 Tax=Halobaculum sp. D14 TaxID=3421642 RepID=UPI003EC0E20E